MRFEMGETNVFCTDRQRSVDFYVGVLGFHFEEEEGGAVRLRMGERRLLLLPFAGGPLEIHPYGTQPVISFDLLTDDVDQAHAHLIAHGIVIEAPPAADRRHLFCRDPDGLVIEIVEIE